MSDDLYADDPQYQVASRDRGQSRKEKAEQKRIEAERKNELLFLTSSKVGRALAYRWMGDAGVFRSSFAAGMPDVTANNEGYRKFGLKVMAEILEAAPERFWLMVKENSGKDDAS